MPRDQHEPLRLATLPVCLIRQTHRAVWLEHVAHDFRARLKRWPCLGTHSHMILFEARCDLLAEGCGGHGRSGKCNVRMHLPVAIEITEVGWCHEYSLLGQRLIDGPFSLYPLAGAIVCLAYLEKPLIP